MATQVPGQTADSVSPKFEIADVHVSGPASDDPDMSGPFLRAGRYELRRATMVDLVRLAYGVDFDKVLGGPSWLETDRFEVKAKLPPADPSAKPAPEALKQMLQSLLTERFDLKAHNDTQPVPVYALTARKATQLKQSDGSGETGCKREMENQGPGRGGGTETAAAPAATPPPAPVVSYTCRNMTMAAFASGLADMQFVWQYIENPSVVVDQTGLDGAWDFSFKYSRRRGPQIVIGTPVTTLFEALDKQLGLKLDVAKIPEPVVVVDSVNRTPTPNSPDAAKAFPPAPVEFEVADIKPTAPDFNDTRFQIQPGGRVNIQGISLKDLIEDMWNISDEMLAGAPKFAETDRWDFVAKAPGATGGPNAEPVDFDTLTQMMKNLLAERFKLAVHMEERPVNAYTLSAVKPKMKKADPSSRTWCKEGLPLGGKNDPRDANPVLGRLMTCQNMSMAQFSDQLRYLANGYVHSPVLDSTGLEGGWDFTLSFSPVFQTRASQASSAPGLNAASDPNGAVSLPEAIERQLGLKLEQQKRPVQVLVIDHVERTPIDN
jgi:uncharacterized protein (TIGR03435 family)